MTNLLPGMSPTPAIGCIQFILQRVLIIPLKSTNSKETTSSLEIGILTIQGFSFFVRAS
ncbi:hypothetical protein BDB01DRAFT_781553 [Pilobolus umbonatus]|nr:hypothetical protein BDB01DRAFT_781553 [Pilobolus umbonatus]